MISLPNDRFIFFISLISIDFWVGYFHLVRSFFVIDTLKIFKWKLFDQIASQKKKRNNLHRWHRWLYFIFKINCCACNNRSPISHCLRKRDVFLCGFLHLFLYDLLCHVHNFAYGILLLFFIFLLNKHFLLFISDFCIALSN